MNKGLDTDGCDGGANRRDMTFLARFDVYSIPGIFRNATGTGMGTGTRNCNKRNM